MGRKVKLTVREIEAMTPGDVLWDSAVRGFGVRQQRTEKSPRTFFLKYRAKPSGKQRLLTIGQYNDTLKGESIAVARAEAERARAAISAKRDPAAEYQAKKAEARAVREVEAIKSETALNKLAPLFIAQMKRRKRWRTRTAHEVERIFNTYVLPKWGSSPIGSIRRSQVSELLDRIEENSGLVMSDRVLAWLRAFFAWQTTRDETFETPIVRGMARIKAPGDRARDRVLSDDEIRSIWAATESAKPSIFGQFVRFLFLTAQRRQDCSDMTRQEVEGSLWVIPAGRYKTKMKHGHAVPLTPEASAVLASVPRFKSFIFTTAGDVPFSGFSKAKRELDRVSGVTGWRLHDIRRTAKTLMQRAQVRPDISERVLGHIIPGVEGVYDRHPYLDEKKDALTRLAALLARILSGEEAKVVELAQLRQ